MAKMRAMAMFLALLAVAEAALLQSRAASKHEMMGFMDSVMGALIPCNTMECVLRETVNAQNRKEMDTLHNRHEFLTKYMKLQEELANNLSPIQAPPIMATLGGDDKGNTPFGANGLGTPLPLISIPTIKR